jgi:hypothetical protein
VTGNDFGEINTNSVDEYTKVLARGGEAWLRTRQIPRSEHFSTCKHCGLVIERGIVVEGLLWRPLPDGNWYHRTQRDIEMGHVPQRFCSTLVAEP